MAKTLTSQKELIARTLKAKRERDRLTQKDLAERLGVDPQTIQRWEKGEREPGFAQMLETILPAYGYRSPDEFFTELRMIESPTAYYPIVIEKAHNSTTNRLGITISYAEAELLGHHTVRIDHIRVQPGITSRPVKHTGYNYLLLLKGKLRLHFSAKPDGPVDQHIDLSEGDGIVFYTSLQHFVVALDGPAEAVIARPTWATPTDRLV